MDIEIQDISEATLEDSTRIWNEIVEEGRAFPQTEPMTIEEAGDFFASQSYTGVALHGDKIVGVYILHPNNVGRCGHLCNASYAVSRELRGMHIGEVLVKDCMRKAAELGFRVLQFNAVVRSNTGALKLYERLGFKKLGVIPGGFRNIDGEYEDIIPHYIELQYSESDA